MVDENRDGIEEIAEVQETPDKVAGRWISEIELAEKEFRSWQVRGNKIIERYKDERPNGKGGARAIVDRERRFAILWANVQTLAPAIYARSPNPQVSRRFRDDDPVGRLASEVLERAIAYSCEDYDFDSVMIQARDDYLLVGRGQAWIRYIPHIQSERIALQVGGEPGQFVDDDGLPVEEYEEDESGAYVMQESVTYEEVRADHVVWTDYLHNPCRNADEIAWVGRKVYMTRDELVERFGEEVGRAVPLDFTPQDAPEQKDNPDLFKKACVYEIWDKPTRKAYWISKSYSQSPLDERDDPLGLKDFFPCPKALYATLGPDKLVPVPDYALYQDQAEELDELTARIGKLTDALRLVGFYAGEAKVEMARVFQPGNENKLIPVDSWAQWAGSGGVKGLMEWVPIQDVVATLAACYNARQQVISDIYQITGIADIMRGDTNPNETATAQGIKAQWGSLRVRDRQKAIAAFARDIIRLKGEIIAEHFSVETLKAMTNVKLLDSPEQKQQIQAQMQQMQMMAQQAQQQGLPPPPMPPVDPEIERMLGLPTWAEVDALLKDDALRSFRIEVETDSTIEPDEQIEKQQAVEFATMLATMLGQALPAVQAAPALMPLIGETIKMVSRRFRAGREMEDIIDRTVDAIGQMPPGGGEQEAPEQPDPAAMMKAQADTAKVQVEAQRTQTDAQIAMAELALKERELQTKQWALQRDSDPQGAA